MRVKCRKVGGSLVVTVPKDVLARSGLIEGDSIVLVVPATGQVLMVREIRVDSSVGPV